mgnify:CR=1 FL=1
MIIITICGVSPISVTEEKSTFNSSNDSPGSNKLLIPPKTKKRTLTKTQKLLPWWFVYVAWVLCLSTAAVAGVFTLLYGVTFPRQKQVFVGHFVSMLVFVFFRTQRNTFVYTKKQIIKYFWARQ